MDRGPRGREMGLEWSQSRVFWLTGFAIMDLTVSGDRALIQTSRIDSTGVTAKGKPPLTLQAGALGLTHCLVMAYSLDCVHESPESKVLSAAWGLAKSPARNSYC